MIIQMISALIAGAAVFFTAGANAEEDVDLQGGMKNMCTVLGLSTDQLITDDDRASQATPQKS